MGSVLPITTLLLLSLSHVLLGSVLPESDIQHGLEKRDVSSSSNKKNKYDECLVQDHTEEEKLAILAKHNEYRSGVSPSSSNMEFMEWDEDLAKIAGLWASVCHWGHGTPNVSLTNNYSGGMGQNLWLGSSEPAGTNAVTAWYNEVQFYTYSTKKCSSSQCGHYKQVVWATTTKVGCSRAFCPVLIDEDGVETGSTNKWIESCQYYPAGNIASTKPYKSGTPCSLCQSGSGWCDDNMCRDCSSLADSSVCDCTKTCQNCGTVTADCMCDCVGGWYGDDCSSVCEDWHKNCNTSPGWPNAKSCNAHPGIPNKCPVMCSVCTPTNECV